MSPLNAEKLKEAKFLQLLGCGGADDDVVLSKGTVLTAIPCSTSESSSSEDLSIGIAEEGESLRVSAACGWTSSAISSSSLVGLL